jgi:NAD(P)-dependent dehydrogenase (short-subunit alcohol dehydrogenase family)
MDPSQAFRCDNQVALVTGGGTGLGLAAARCLAAAGARIVITGRRAGVLEEAAREIGPAAVPLPCDVSRLEELPWLLKEAERRAGPIDILVNNAGFQSKKPAVEVTDIEFGLMLQTHVSAAFALSRESAKGMLARGRGSIVMISSMAALFGVPNVAPYSAAKAAVIGLTRELAVEWSGRGVRVNAILPGWIDTPMVRAALGNDPPRRDRVLSRAPMGRLGDPDDIGWAVVYLCSPAAKFVTGSSLVVDGGMSIGF